MGEFDYRKARVELRQRIQECIAGSGLSSKAVAGRIQLTEPTFSKILNNKQSIRLKELDALIGTLELPEEDFYRHYIGECYQADADTRKLKLDRAREFVITSYSKGYMELANPLLSELLDISKKNIRIIYDIAEELYEKQKFEAAKVLYRRVIQEETNLLADHYSLSCFKYFLIMKSNIREAYEPSIDLERHVEQLPTREWKIEAYFWLAKYSYVTEDWDRLRRMARGLIEVTYGYNEEMYGYGLLYLGFAVHRKKDFDEAIRLTYQYENINLEFRDYAIGNRLIYLIDRGETHYVPELIAYAKRLKVGQNAVRPIMSSYLNANMLKEAGEFLADISEYMSPFNQNDLILLKQYLHFYYLKAVYLLRIDERTQAVSDLLQAIEIAEKLNDYNLMKKCLYLFLENRQFTTTEQQEVVKLHVKGGDFPL
ncbi:helix-turn-helix domain-containing protein [Brevibacillus dissolubilis]|uniref:helix-turn-helix domain-containing protein n=1 Tax=Brevibacillus dissolubilis TaxID=1844116 RepID=UPI001116D094|nr:helix-turn-helix transcriptional regulator [Brevibacillus dissolubilis]